LTQPVLRVAALVLLACGQVTCGGANLASSRVTVKNIRRVSLGMSEAEVIAILGPPVMTEPVADLGSQRKVMHYSRPAKGARWYPMLWVHLQHDRVAEVYAKRYILWGADDEGIYLLSKEQPQPVATGLETAFPK
jgi:hypothetical protein